MSRELNRRQFIHVVMSSAAGAYLGASAAGCGPGNEISRPDSLSDAVFSNGVASGDPSPDSVIIWTRVVPPTTGPVSVRYEVATDNKFTSAIATGTVEAVSDWDHTLRIRVEGLEPYTHYYYRFFALDGRSAVGRTKTAPLPEQDVPVRFAVASCQDFVGRWYHSWRSLASEPEVDFVLFLGDYIYESIADPRHQFPQPGRELSLPDGLNIHPDVEGGEGDLRAHTLADYRALYKQYKVDRDLQEAHRLFPFISIWDDHEFANDCWRDYSTDLNEAEGSEQNTKRREDATRAWYEYQPIDVSFHEGKSFPDDITIYRNLRYGKHVELFLTDQRYYRDDHLIPEGPMDSEVGKFLENSPLGSRIFAKREGFDKRESAAKPTMLGSAQRKWFVESVQKSKATWKAWASALMVSEMAMDLRQVSGVPELFANDYYFKLDHWDGFRSERNEILAALSNVDDLVIFSGDLHGFYASHVLADYDKNVGASSAVATEFTTSGISSIPLQDQLNLFTKNDPLLSLLKLDEAVAQFDDVLLDSNAHYVESDSRHNGITIVEADAHAVKVEWLRALDVTDAAAPKEADRLIFEVQQGTRKISRKA
jgi:alkaline phosphatase D